MLTDRCNLKNVLPLEHLRSCPETWRHILFIAVVILRACVHGLFFYSSVTTRMSGLGKKKIVHSETVVNSKYTHAGEECIKKDYWLKKHLFAEMTNCLLNKNEPLKTNHVPIYLPSRPYNIFEYFLLIKTMVNSPTEIFHIENILRAWSKEYVKIWQS